VGYLSSSSVAGSGAEFDHRRRRPRKRGSAPITKVTSTAARCSRDALLSTPRARVGAIHARAAARLCLRERAQRSDRAVRRRLRRRTTCASHGCCSDCEDAAASRRGVEPADAHAISRDERRPHRCARLFVRHKQTSHANSAIAAAAPPRTQAPMSHRALEGGLRGASDGVTRSSAVTVPTSRLEVPPSLRSRTSYHRKPSR
jgi:hypothetical protein